MTLLLNDALDVLLLDSSRLASFLISDLSEILASASPFSLHVHSTASSSAPVRPAADSAALIATRILSILATEGGLDVERWSGYRDRRSWVDDDRR